MKGVMLSLSPCLACSLGSRQIVMVNKECYMSIKVSACVWERASPSVSISKALLKQTSPLILPPSRTCTLSVRHTHTHTLSQTSHAHSASYERLIGWSEHVSIWTVTLLYIGCSPVDLGSYYWHAGFWSLITNISVFYNLGNITSLDDK